MVWNYIVVREELSPMEQVLQGLHAALICRAVRQDDALVFLKAPGVKLKALADRLEVDLQPYRYFEDGELNSVAFRCVQKEDRKHFRDFKMVEIPKIQVKQEVGQVF